MKEELKKKIDSFRLVSSNIAKSLHDNLVVEWTYNSNAVGGKSVVEHLETINH